MVHQIREIGINDIDSFVKLLTTIYDESDYLFIILGNMHRLTMTPLQTWNITSHHLLTPFT